MLVLRLVAGLLRPRLSFKQVEQSSKYRKVSVSATIYRMSLLLAGSISLESTFKVTLTSQVILYCVEIMKPHKMVFAHLVIVSFKIWSSRVVRKIPFYKIEGWKGSPPPILRQRRRETLSTHTAAFLGRNHGYLSKILFMVSTIQHPFTMRINHFPNCLTQKTSIAACFFYKQILRHIKKTLLIYCTIECSPIFFPVSLLQLLKLVPICLCV